MLNLAGQIKQINDWPRPGAQYLDTAALWADPIFFKKTISALAEPYRRERLDFIVGIEARGFILASALAYELGVGVLMVRKKGKLPPPIIFEQYDYEYSTDIVVLKRDMIKGGERVVLVDDVLATGATMGAATKLVERLQGAIVGLSFVVEKTSLGGRKKLSHYHINCLIQLP